MADAPDVLGFLKNGSALFPGRGIHDVAGARLEQSKTIIGSPTAAGGIDDKDVVIAAQHGGALANRHALAFPGLIRDAEQRAREGKRDRVLHRGDVKVLLAVAFAGPAGPDEIPFGAAQIEDRAVDCPAAGLHFAAATVGALGIVGFGFEDPHAVVLVPAVVSGVIDEPAAADAMQFRRPDRAGVPAGGGRVPDADARVRADAGDGEGASDDDVALVPALAVVVLTFMVDHPRVRRFGWQ